MTLAIGQASDRRRRAFTLVELILVLGLMVVAVSMVAPRLSGFVRGQSLGSEARRLAAVMHAGQARAVSEGVSIVLWIDEKMSRYGIEIETPGDKGDLKADSFTADENVRLAVVPNQNGAGAPPMFNNLPAIRFLADGSVDENSPKKVQLKTSGGGQLWLIEASDRRHYDIRDSDKE
jgi:type II secretion system protein H